jgi:phosphoglycerate dehydrogenase-like enzyme
VARRFRALGARVVAARRRAAGDDDAGVEVRAGDDAIDWVLERSDYGVVTLPHTPETRGLIGRAQLERMRRSAVLINVGRGSVLDEAALADALTAGRLRGAALDVFAREPLPESSPLWSLPNLLIMPHVSGASRNFWRRQTELIEANLDRYLAGRPLLNVVDKDAGY